MMNNKLIQLLRQETKANLLKLFVGFIIIGVTNALVLVIVHDVTEAQGLDVINFRLLMLFVLCVATFCYTKRVVNIWLTTHVQQAILQLRLRILDKVRSSRLMSYEGLDRSQLINALSENTLVIVEGAKYFGEGVPAAIMLLCSFIYVGVISKAAMIIVAVCVPAAAVVIWALNRSIAEDLNTAMHKEDEFLTAFHQLLDGFKELKMSRRKSGDLFDNYLSQCSKQAKDLNTKAAVSVVRSDIYNYLFFYLLLASMLFLLPKLTVISAGETMSITTILLFLLGNGTVFVQALPNITKTDVAIGNITRMEEALDDLEPPVDSSLANPWLPEGDERDIVLRNLYFSYAGPRDQSFSVHVDHLTVKAGELLYIQGGNGSGKSTLLKLLTGLYRPAVGSIEYGGTAVSMENLQYYRECFSIIFADFHLFDRVYGLEGVDAGRVEELLVEMQLSAKTSYAQGAFRNLNLSTGQRKRLALLVALLEDRPVCVFDEVAADQDPQFRKYLYEVMLQNLKRQGKTIIAVTHDDRYFHTADRVLKMEYGRLLDEQAE